MKLYWRYKKDGKWSWKAADVHDQNDEYKSTRYIVYLHHEEEEE